MSSAYKQRTEWYRRGYGFSVAISRAENHSDNEGPYLWAIYLHVFKRHPLFDQLVRDGRRGDLVQSMPLHWGESYWRHVKDDDGETITVGCDYHHLHDTHYTFDESPEVFMRDADALYAWMIERTPKEVAA